MLMIIKEKTKNHATQKMARINSRRRVTACNSAASGGLLHRQPMDEHRSLYNPNIIPNSQTARFQRQTIEIGGDLI